MCGIAGFNWEDRELVGRMSEAIAHRGPDADGLWVGSGFSLGHRRLSIIDLSAAGIQPMANDSGHLRLIYNGEIYNFMEVRADLEARGYTFRSRTDSEVILKAYEEWGPECLRRLNGMFAFAIHDAQTGALFIARDRLGVKPLYYWASDGRFAFASEIKALLCDPRIPRTPDVESIFHYIGYEFVPAPRTMFDGIKKLPPSHYLVLRPGQQPEVHRYWDVTFDPDAVEEHDEAWYREGLIAQIDAAVKKRLISDVPLGVFLSGGTDSSAIVAFMHRHVKEPLKTFSLGYEDPTFSELPYARQVAQAFGTEQHELLIEPISIPLIETAAWFLDEPMTDLSTIPFLLICRKARERVTVCLSGEGGDESFVGYDRFKAAKFDELYRLLPAPLRRYLISPIVQALPDQRQKKGPINILKRFLQGSALPATGGHMRWQYFLDPELSRSLFRPHVLQAVSPDPFEPVARCLAGVQGRDRLDREIYADLRFTMPDSVLMKVDKMSMSIALEVRVPFLDYELVQFAAAIPGRYKLRGLTTKAILRDSLKGILPDNIVWRKKQGYSFPIKNWLREELKDYMTELLNESPIIREHLDREVVNRLIREHLARAHNHNHILWSLMNLAVWHKLFVLEEFTGSRRDTASAVA
jgi:asparagine synthase (glutamine-hydrolysing)